jgi:RHS repeat-associated protein
MLLAAFIAATSALHATTVQTPLEVPMPDFQTPAQLAKWRADTTAKTVAKEAAQASASAKSESSGFYTGKPYLAESGSYAFKYREYNPEMNRWTTVDPSGFPDGANNRVYAPNPANELDNNGLNVLKATDSIGNGNGRLDITLTQAPLVNGNNVTMLSEWSTTGLAGISTQNQNGWVVQTVTINISMTVIANYTEAWQVINGVVINSTDGFSFTAPDNNPVMGEISGSANYYNDAQVANNSPSTWGSQALQANGAPSLNGAPPSWFSVNNSVAHSMSFTWE